MSAIALEDALSVAELRFSEVSAALVSGEPLALDAASAALRQAALDLSAVLPGHKSAINNHQILKSRLATLSTGMAAQRESLVRRTVLAERALNAMVPATRSSTYAPAAGPYGSPGRQTGAFKFLAA